VSVSAIAQQPKKCLTCRQALVLGERVVCSSCIGRAKAGAALGAKFGAHVLAAAAGDALRREMPATFKTLEHGYRSWRQAEARRDAVDAPERKVVIDFGAARAKKAGA
jgi:hypothetical protein